MISSVGSFTPYNKLKNSSTVSFRGARLNVLKYAVDPRKKVNIPHIKALMGITPDVMKEEVAAGIVSPVESLNTPLKRHKAGFFHRLAQKYCIEYFVGDKKNDSILRKKVYDIYNSVKYPTNAHKVLVTSSNFNLSELLVLFNELKSEPKQIKLVAKLIGLRAGGFRTKVSLEDVKQIINSDYSKSLNDHFFACRPGILALSHNMPDAKLPQILKKYFEVVNIK